MNVQPLLAVTALALLSVSCNSGPTPPEPGTPAFLWNASKQTYRDGDFAKTSDNLSEILRGDNDYAARARVWQVMLTAGMAQGYSELATAYDAGAKANRANPMPFRKQVTDLRTRGGRAALDLTEAVHDFVAKDQSADVLLAFAFPAGSVAKPGSYNKVYAGMTLQESEAQGLQSEMAQHGAVLALCELAGSPGDSAKVLDKFKAGEVKLPRATYLYGAAKLLYDNSELFGSNKLDQPQRLTVMCEEALKALKGVPENKDTKDLTAKIQAALKKIKKGPGV